METEASTVTPRLLLFAFLSLWFFPECNQQQQPVEDLSSLAAGCSPCSSQEDSALWSLLEGSLPGSSYAGAWPWVFIWTLLTGPKARKTPMSQEPSQRC